MDWIATLNLIKDKLLQHGYKQAVDRIVDAQMFLGTPGEMYIEVMNELIRFKESSSQEYKLIEKEIDQLLDYGKALKYYVPPSIN